MGNPPRQFAQHIVGDVLVLLRLRTPYPGFRHGNEIVKYRLVLDCCLRNERNTIHVLYVKLWIPGILDDSILPAINHRSEEHTSKLQSLMRISYAVFCLKKKNQKINISPTQRHKKPSET